MTRLEKVVTISVEKVAHASALILDWCCVIVVDVRIPGAVVTRVPRVLKRRLRDYRFSDRLEP